VTAPSRVVRCPARRLLLGALVLCLLLSLGCGSSKQSKAPGGRGDLIPLRIGGEELLVEVVETPERMRAGLMFRRNLPENQGMLFVYREPTRITLWMKNTYIPLSAAFLDEEGRIINIARRMEPHDETTRHAAAAPAMFALEVNAGWFERHGIGPGDRLELPERLRGRGSRRAAAR
jgi:hypothetical protein